MSQESKPQIQATTPWFERALPGVTVRNVAPELAPVVDNTPKVSCKACETEIPLAQFEQNERVCPHCDHHAAMLARHRLEWFLDDVQQELGQEFTAKNPLNFVDSRPYPERMQEAQQKTGETEGLVVLQGTLKNLPVVACAFEFEFMGGSMGTVVGDRFVRAAEYALAHQQPLICFAASGGARMQEGMLSLMQMARTSAAIKKLKNARIPYIVVLTHPVYGGVTASLAMLGDIHLAEPKAMIGFAGKRVIEQTVREKLSEPFQRAEYLLDHGVVDQIVHRRDLRDTVHRLLTKLLKINA
ncbi:MAG: acetyl-CoA carboxylase, carboxyltransferase subunit beta [Acinetobacter sp.]|nr:acetyl-CoA carboxylase, carboxyltransferase subunit beta [Acinetobacter sp.]